MKKILFPILALVLAFGIALPLGAPAMAVSESWYDMRYYGGAPIPVEINGAIWLPLPSTLPTGSGVFNAFFRVQKNGAERGYNTNGRPLQFDEKTSPTFTHAAVLADVPIIEYPEGSGNRYREFQLDINEKKSSPDWYISLDKFQVWTTNDPNLLGYDEVTHSFPTGTDAGEALLVYDLDGDGNTWIKMDYGWNTGSGKRDYRVLVPESAFADKELTYVVIFTAHGYQGGIWACNDGFEEWGIEAYDVTPAIKSGYKWHDLNADGVKDAGEPGLEGWTIYVDYNGNGDLDAGEPSAVTAADGSYTITGINPGTWKVREVAQAGWTQTYPASGYHEETFNSGDSLTGNDFGNWQPGSLEVTKTVSWSGVTPDESKTFEICITGPSYPSGDCKTADYDGEVLTWDNLIPGDYTVTETDPGSEWTVVVTGSPAAVVSGGTASAEVTNTYKRGSLEVTKTVSWSGVTPDESKTFEICITGPSYPSGDCKTADYDGGVLTWDNLIPGIYTVTETDTGTEWIVVITGSPANVVAGETASAEVTNTYKRGSLEVTKTVNWSGVTPDTSKTFEICITGPSYPTGDCKEADYDGGVLTWDNLIPGTYTVTETDTGTEWIVVITGSPANVVAGETASAEVTNTYKRGSLEVTKTVNWSGVTPDTSKIFEICITGPSYPTGDCKEADYDGGVLTWDNLIPGEYTVTETNPGTEWIVVITGSPANVVAGETASAEVTNTYKRGSLEVTKTVNWSGVTPDTSKIFEICITGPSYPTGDCKEADYDGGVLTWDNLIPGTYTVTETDPGTEWTVVITGSPANVVAGETASAEVTNTQSCPIIYGYKWDDYSHDGEWDTPDEPPLDGWTINLVGPESDTAVTGAGGWPYGYYEFEVCTNGDYTVSEDILPGDWHQTFPSDPDTYTVSVDVQNGPYGPYNFGNAQTCTIIYGYKWSDYDYDGEWDKPDEPPLENWEIHLDGPVTGVTYTNATGYYEFTICDVTGSFTVSEVVRGGYTQSYPSAPGTHEVEVNDLKKVGGYGPYDFGNRNPPMPVGGIIIPVNKLAILAPWIALFAAIVVGAAILTRRRRA